MRETRTIAQVSIAIAVICLIVAPFIFTRSAIWNIFSFSDTASIGETIGGITAPFVGLLGAILLYLALTEQVTGNRISREQIQAQRDREALQQESNQVHDLYNNLKSSIDNFRYLYLKTEDFGTGTYLAGSEAIYKLFHDVYCTAHVDEKELRANPKITEITSILETCEYTLTKLNASQIADRDVLKTLTMHQFKYRIRPRLEHEMGKLHKHSCNACNTDHGLPDHLADMILRLNAQL